MVDKQRHKQRRTQLWFGAMLALLLLAGCGGRHAPRPGARLGQPALHQPLSLEESYAPPLIARRGLRTTAPTTTAEAPDAATLLTEGRTLYTVNCAPCHRANGEGQLQRFPALNQNAFVTNGAPQPLIRTVLYGRGVMPAFTPTLNDREIAAVLTYIRQAWNNDATAVTSDAVRESAAAAAQGAW